MHEVAAPLLTRWVNFYVMVGSSAAALTGLQFVVLALIDEMRPRNVTEGVDAFSTPTVVYFSTVLLLAAILCAPWDGLAAVAALIALCGAAGVVYAGIVTRRARRQTVYRLVLEDWLWHITFPLTAHALLLAAGLALARHPGGALYTIATAAVFLLFIGLHNAWDSITYMMTQRPGTRRGGAEQPSPGDPPPGGPPRGEPPSG
jgi:hypothetical protein